MEPFSIRQRDVPDYLRDKFGFTCSISELTTLAKSGNGPPRSKLSRNVVVYPRAELDKWAKARIKGAA